MSDGVDVSMMVRNPSWPFCPYFRQFCSDSAVLAACETAISVRVIRDKISANPEIHHVALLKVLLCMRSSIFWRTDFCDVD